MLTAIGYQVLFVIDTDYILANCFLHYLGMYNILEVFFLVEALVDCLPAKGRWFFILKNGPFGADR